MLKAIIFFQAEDGIRDTSVTGVQTCALPILDASGDGTVSPGSLYVANSLQELFDAGQHVSVFSQVTYGDAAEMEAGSNEAAGTAGVNKAQTVDFSRIMVTNSLQELLAATIGIQ